VELKEGNVTVFDKRRRMPHMLIRDIQAELRLCILAVNSFVGTSSIGVVGLKLLGSKLSRVVL
jgi:hypothetical protein